VDCHANGAQSLPFLAGRQKDKDRASDNTSGRSEECLAPIGRGTDWSADQRPKCVRH
jgi:hypothetical protein